jgi:2-oxoglutarate ferredoxin oxidoreductase subunit alpha
MRIDPATGQNNFAIVQMEDELAAIGMAIGANWNGSRAFTATSGPGLSLMNEFLGLAYFAEIPVVLIDVQRTGPSTGMPTRTQQSDITEAAYASHGDTKQVVLFPGTPKECFDMTADAFDLAEQLQTPIIMLTDLDLGMNDNMSDPLTWDDSREYNRGKVFSEEDLNNMKERHGRYLDVDGDAIPYRTYPGTHPSKGSFFTRGTSRDEYAAYTEDGNVYARNMDRLLRKWETIKTYMPKPDIHPSKAGSKTGILFFGTSSASSYEAQDILAAQGVDVDAICVKAFPFTQEVEDFIDDHETVFVIEQNRDGQMRSLLINECDFLPQKLVSLLVYNGMPITASFIAEKITQHMQGANVKPLRRSSGKK